MSVVNIAQEALADGFNAGNDTVGQTEQQLGDAYPVRKHIVVRAATGNTDFVYVGRKGNAVNGFVLDGGEQTPPIYVDDVSKVFVIGGAASQTYSWISN
jgi:hypothetical protein